MRPAALAAGLALAWPVLAFAQPEDVQSAAERYVALPAVQDMIRGLGAPELLAEELRAHLPGAEDMPPEEIERMAAIVSDELDGVRPALERALVAAAVEHFTLEEIEAMIAFAASPVGSGVLEKAPGFAIDAMAAAGPQIQQATFDAMQRIREDDER